MKVLSIFTIGMTLAALSLNASDRPRLVSMPIQKVFAPIGFDSNDKVQILVAGELPNTCHKVANVEVKVNSASKTVEVRQNAHLFSGVCLPVTVPFATVVDLGLMDEGSYKVKDLGSPTALAVLPVAQATVPTSDDYLYAPVDEAFLIHDPRPMIILRGEFTDKCTFYKDQMVRIVQDTIVIQPIAERRGTGTCEQERRPFEISVPLSSEVHGTFLLHVRSLNGQSINKIVAIQ